MNQAMLAAFLTVLGFSINDTVIIFDRIRENKTIHRGEKPIDVDESINQRGVASNDQHVVDNHACVGGTSHLLR